MGETIVVHHGHQEQIAVNPLLVSKYLGKIDYKIRLKSIKLLNAEIPLSFQIWVG